MAKDKELTLESLKQEMDLRFGGLEELVNDLATKVAKQSANGSVSMDTKDEGITVPTETFEVEGQAYRFKMAAFSIKPHGSLTAAEALESSVVLADIVKNYPDLIEKA